METNERQKGRIMRSDYSLYIIALPCFLLALLIFMSHTQNPPVHLTSGDETTDLVAMMFLPILGLVIVGVGYGVKPKKATGARAKKVPPPPRSKPRKKPKKKARARKRRQAGNT